MIVYDLKITKKAGKVTFSENGSWIYFSFCYFVFQINPQFKNFDPYNFSQGVEKVVFFQVFHVLKN
jgi:hypothetical protein